MLTRIVLRRPLKVEGESPFWISFSDLMSALMIVFLLVMAVTLISVTREVGGAELRKLQREQEVRDLMQTLQAGSRAFPGVKVDEATYRIDLGDVVRFERGRWDIEPEGARFLRRYVPVLLQVQRTLLGKRWIRRIVVEGFTDQDGSYLYNLALSLNRSRRVVCVLYADPDPGERPLDDGEKRQIRDLFLVGGYSFNGMKASKEASRRVELKLEFWALDEAREASPTPDDKEFGQC